MELFKNKAMRIEDLELLVQDTDYAYAIIGIRGGHAFIDGEVFFSEGEYWIETECGDIQVESEGIVVVSQFLELPEVNEPVVLVD